MNQYRAAGLVVPLRRERGQIDRQTKRVTPTDKIVIVPMPFRKTSNFRTPAVDKQENIILDTF